MKLFPNLPFNVGARRAVPGSGSITGHGMPCPYIVLFCLLFLFSTTARADGFATLKLLQLETQVRQQFTPEDIAKRLSDLSGFSKWPDTITPAYRLYVAIHWLDQNHSLEAANLLSQTAVEVDWQDLKKYYSVITMMNLSRYTDANKYLDELEAVYKNDTDVLYLRVLGLTAAGLLVQAVGAADKLIKIDSRSGKAYLQRGVLRLVLLSHELAVKDFKKALALLPKSDAYRRQQAYLQAGIIYYKYLNDSKKGEDFLKKGIELDPNSELVVQMKQVMMPF